MRPNAAEQKAQPTGLSGEQAKSDGSSQQVQAPATAGHTGHKSKIGADDAAIVRQAAAYRTKYKKQMKIRIPVIQIGFHPANGHGQPPSASRCISLLQDILDIGFDAEEADNNAVCVEANRGDESIQEFNREAVDGIEAMAPIDCGVIQYGSLSHSHLNQILKNLKAGAHAGIESICDGDGRLSLSKLRLKDVGFAAAVDGGLSWEVLDRKIQEEEPEALDIIQTALNAKNGLFLLAHEMQALAKLSAITSALAQAGQQVAWASAQDRLRQTMPGFAEDESFLELYRYVIDLGSDEAPFLPNLKAFHCQFVDPKVRKIRLSAFGALNQLPEEFPHLKIAGLKFMYACDQTQVLNGFCPQVSKSTINKLCNDAGMRALTHVGEEILRFFHVKCAEAIASVQNRQWKVRFLGNLDNEIFQEMVAVKGDDAKWRSAQTRKDLMHRVADRFYSRACQSCKGVPVRVWKSPAPEQSGPRTVAELHSKIIEFDHDGKAVTKQDTVEQSGGLEVFEWSQFMQTASISEQTSQEQSRAVIFSTICSMHDQMQTSGSWGALEVVKRSASSSKEKSGSGGRADGIWVRAKRDIPAGALMLPPLVKEAKAISFKSSPPPWGLKIGVSRGEVQIQAAMVYGSAGLPNLGGIVSSEAGVAAMSHHSWNSTHFPWPFWLITRASTQVECNCVLQTCTSRQITTCSCQGRDPLVDDMEAMVPVMVNDKDIKQGDELIVHWIPWSKPKQKTQATRKSWVDAAEAALKRKKVRASPKGEIAMAGQAA